MFRNTGARGLINWLKDYSTKFKAGFMNIVWIFAQLGNLFTIILYARYNLMLCSCTYMLEA